MSTILQKDFAKHKQFGGTHHNYVDLEGLLSYDYILLMFCFAITAFFCQSFVGSKIIRERLIIIRNLGLQLESESLQGGVVNKRFIDINRVRDIVINEVSRQL